QALIRGTKKLLQEEAETAKQNALLALAQVEDHRGALENLGRAEALLIKIGKQPFDIRKLPEIVKSNETVEERLEWGKDYFWIGKYDKAEEYFEAVLVEDPYHVEAMRYLKKIAELQRAIATRERNAWIEKKMTDVRSSWVPPIKSDIIKRQGPDRTKQVDLKTPAMILEEKMEKIVIPSIEFRSVNIQDVVKFLVDASIAGDPEKSGVNIILNLRDNSPAAPSGGGNRGGGGDDLFAPDDSDPFSFDDDGGFDLDPLDTGGGADADAGGGGGANRAITLSLRRVSLLDAIRYITEVANLKYRIENNAVIITPPGAAVGRIITRIYPVQPSLIEKQINSAEFDVDAADDEFVAIGGRDTDIAGPSTGQVRELFTGFGVSFPEGTSISYNAAIASLIVANTPENLEVFERILAKINVVPNQVEIEARFVEIGQTDLTEMGLEWIFTDDVEIAERKGLGPAATKPRIIAHEDPDGITKGLRYFSLGTSGLLRQSQGEVEAPPFVGNILRVSGILTNPELSVVLHALNQKGNVDVLSAPRVTTRTGLNAIIEVVEEIIYPSEFETNVQSFDSVVTDIDGDLRNVRTRAVVVTPGSFETREVGVILNVTPTVGPDGYTIELTMSPEVAELVDWIQYGSVFGDQVINIPQPIFSSRNVTTSIVIWDGQTVVMGGLISERFQKMDDRVPILGDIPFFGRLFQSKGSESQKRNLLIFVTARVVDPAGNPIHKDGSFDLISGAPTPAGLPINNGGGGL
ncbi:MAG: hypothetical protein AAF492_09010, partial [Verrucomicrobiota bacterium]